MINQNRLEEAQSLEALNAEIEEEMKRRKRSLWRHQKPQDTGIIEALQLLTKSELDVIRGHLQLAGVSSLKKKDLVGAMALPLVAFAKSWLLNITQEQYAIFKRCQECGGSCAELDLDDIRYDYMRGLGMIFSASAGRENIWFMAKEILRVFTELDTLALAERVRANEEVVRLATGQLFYYGTRDYDALYETVRQHMKGELPEFHIFMGILINAACWQGMFELNDTGAQFYGVLDPEGLEEAQCGQPDEKAFTYEELYVAGSAEYVPQCESYEKLKMFLRDVLTVEYDEAQEIAMELSIMAMNGDAFHEMFSYLQSLVQFPDKQTAQELIGILTELYNDLPRWADKGYSLKELNLTAPAYRVNESRDNVMKIAAAKEETRRNDPCPCGSGKKYKKCCLV